MRVMAVVLAVWMVGLSECAHGETVAREDAIRLLEAQQRSFEERAPLSFIYSTDYELVGGRPGELASERERRVGEARVRGDDVETRHVVPPGIRKRASSGLGATSIL